jgi:YgiT-type zinc finger domain-containing protein
MGILPMIHIHATSDDLKGHCMKPKLCAFCGKFGVYPKKVNRSYGRDKDLIVIENIPVLHCANCGETCLTATTLKKIEKIKGQKARIQASRSARVLAYTATRPANSA